MNFENLEISKKKTSTKYDLNLIKLDFEVQDLQLDR